jgi:NADPH-dependent curcumin reductase CurA
MAPTSARSWVLANKPEGLPVLDGANATFKLEIRDLPELKDGQVLLKTLFLSNDPAQRGWIDPFIKPERLYTTPVKVNTPMHSRGIAEVVESKSSELPKGSIVTGSVGWSEYVVLDAKTCNPIAELPGGLSMTHYLGALGLTGMTAWYGLKVISEAKESDVVVVSGAAGATGSMVVQFAKKVIGCKTVIGIAGSAAKCKWVESLGADKCLNYKDSNFKDELIKATPDYADVYFDNVGGEILDFMITRMAKYGRIAACGAIADYNSSQSMGLRNWFEVITMRLQIKGFIVTDYLPHAAEMIGIFKKAITEGKLSVGNENEHVVDTKFEDVPKTWLTLFEGGNTGKLVTKIV